MSRCLSHIVLLVSMLAVPLWSQVSAPQVGLVRYADGRVYPVGGIEGNYVLGKPLFESVDALSFANCGGLLFRKGILWLLDTNGGQLANFDTGTTKAIVGIAKTQDSAIAWLPLRSLLVFWNGLAFSAVTSTGGVAAGEVLSIRKTGIDTASILIQTSPENVEQDLISLANGSVFARSSMPVASGNLYEAENGIVNVQDGEVTLTSSTTATHRSVPIRARAVQFEQVSTDCIHLHADRSGRDWILHLSGDHLALYDLPVALSREAK